MAPDWILRASVANASKMGGYNGLTAQTLSQATPYGPESVTAFEIGLRRPLPGDRGRIDVGVFFNSYRNKQETGFAVTPVGNIPGLTNIPRAEVFGLELDADVKISARIRARLGLAVTESEIVRYEQIDSIRKIYPAIVRVDTKGLRLPNTPRWHGNAALVYEHPLKGEHLVRAETGLSFRSKSYGTADARNVIDDHVVWDGRLTWSDKARRRAASIWGRNMLDAH